MTRETIKLGGITLACVLAALGSGLASLLGANAMANSGRRDTERKFCQVVSYSRATEERKLAGYEKEPPATETGRSQRDQVVASLASYRDLERALGCPPDRKE